ncbi:hypothetical protein ACRQNN_006085 [Pseudomonas aeruginosa]|uniref:hypothetical protein n=1 Tax=Pseudomonas aeruginosa TaxID=287 RepID=UPI0022928B78|nr:hypothetical protein [Pseudomonas aeruginosa]HCU1978870.1 hypothetical protein [Pseudomonas aeruginosa]
MSIETQIAALVTAANNLTAAVDSKIGAIDTRMDTAEAEFELWRNEKDLEGDPGLDGTIRRNIAQGYISSTGGTHTMQGATGIFTAVDLGSSVSVYIHIKLPLNINLHDRMFWINIKGYSYGSAKIIDETLVGYCYASGHQLTNKSAFGNMTPDLYVDSNGNVVARLLVPNIYVTTIRVDCMKVGGAFGVLFDVGQLVAKLSLSDTVVF